mgnify:CR=1 FL=1
MSVSGGQLTVDTGTIIQGAPIGTNTTAAHPVLSLKVKEAVRRGATLIVANPKDIDLAEHAETAYELGSSGGGGHFAGIGQSALRNKEEVNA